MTILRKIHENPGSLKISTPEKTPVNTFCHLLPMFLKMFLARETASNVFCIRFGRVSFPLSESGACHQITVLLRPLVTEQLASWKLHEAAIPHSE